VTKIVVGVFCLGDTKVNERKKERGEKKRERKKKSRFKRTDMHQLGLPHASNPVLLCLSLIFI